MKKENGERNVKFSKKVDNFIKNCPNQIVHTITIIVELLWICIAIIPNIKIALVNGFSSNTSNAIIMAIAMMMMIYAFIELMIFDMGKRRTTKWNNNIIEKYNLSKDEFKEVLWRYYYSDDYVIHLMKKTIREAEIKLYAKLIYSTDRNIEEVQIISKDKDGKILDEPIEISLILFVNNFISKR